MKVALVYDRLNKWGGAERVLLALHKLFPEAPLFTSVYDSQRAPWANVFDIRTSFLQNFPFAMRHELYAFLMPLAFESFNFDGFDLVISVTSEAAKGIITKPKTLHVCYCLTPTRYLWSAYNDYFNSPLFRFLTKPIVSYLRTWDKIAAQRPDYYIAISKEVQGRIKKYYRRESTVIYPSLSLSGPVSLRPRPMSSPASLDAGTRRGSPALATRQNYFLLVSRLVRYKRIDIAIRAFNKLKLPLKIVGVGSQERYLRNISGKTIEFLGYLTEGELISYYKGCLALIFPGKEDFGITIVEAQGFGKPVIAYRGGGALETVIEGKTGEFFDKQNSESLIEVIEQFDARKYKASDCINNAKRFSYERFKKEFMDVISNVTI